MTLCRRSADRDLRDEQRALSRGARLSVSVPPIAATRSCSPRIPLPLVASAPPTPSSPTSIRNVVGVVDAAMLTFVALACLATLASPSETTK